MRMWIMASLASAAVSTMDCGTNVEKTQEHWCRVYAPATNGRQAQVSYFVTDFSNGLAEVDAKVLNPDGTIASHLCSGLSSASDSACYVGNWRVALDRSTQFGQVQYVGGNPFGDTFVASCVKTTGENL